MRKSIYPAATILSGILALLALSGCVTSEEPGANGSTRVSVNSEIDVEDIESPDEDSGLAGILYTNEVYYDCDGDDLIEEEYEDVTRFAISNDHLYIWPDQECSAVKLSGSSSTVIGTWKSVDLTSRIPLAYRPEECTQSPENYLEDLFEDASITYTISNTKIKGKLSGTLCYAKIIADQLEGTGDFEVLSSGCSTFKIKNDYDKVATITTGYLNDSLVITYAYDGETCRTSQSLNLTNNPPVCSEDSQDAAQEAYEDYMDCMEDFYDDFEIAWTSSEKQSVMKSQVSKARALHRTLKL